MNDVLRRAGEYGRGLYRNRATTSVLMLALASLVSIALVAVRVYFTGTRGYLFLIWNLALAWVPFLCSWWLFAVRPRSRVPAAAAAATWLLFFPNAPYIRTDLIHLRSRTDAPVWYDAMMITAFAWTGMLLGLASLRMMQSLVRQRVGKVVSWAFA